ncbi:hypothetical protein BCE75_102280 [Isoptericola sp. CG 20/1183]|uniref:Uncharacterized protein n=1 Tax=Isoptericola halotolerans TaxID=300560 RepID=A0ABX5EIQ8_9MICO|nr:hypothetical protein BCE75_102280 [Isoptericola sp. CG 20/1183]PRZ10367.1 hypothetical protein BCL65_101512 [Isoptericola halotolerans]
MTVRLPAPSAEAGSRSTPKDRDLVLYYGDVGYTDTRGRHT